MSPPDLGVNRLSVWQRPVPKGTGFILPCSAGSVKNRKTNCRHALFSVARQIGVCRAGSRFPVIARPVRTLVVAIPPVRGEMYRKLPEKMGIAAILGGNRYLVPFNGGIATPLKRTGSQ